ncbi:hypothetical protein GGU11DRAFT_751246 [Lentinula aff. detonsa]|nr:hypothetical protein GGU11DRAFT_751246 [Lentinula aff. detonsa]
MSTTSSPARPARSPTPVLKEEDAELQAFLAAEQREAQEKWRRLREEKASGNIVDERKVVEEDVDGVVEVEKEIVPKVEPKPRYSGPEETTSRAYGGGVEPLRSWSIPIQIPSWSRFPVPANGAFAVIKSVGRNPMLQTQLPAIDAMTQGGVVLSSGNRRSRGFDPRPTSPTGRRRGNCVTPSRS